MSIELNEKTVGIWFMPLEEKQDWLASITEIEPDKKYQLVYRHRYHKDDKAFDSEDEKSWYKATIAGTRAYVLGTFREFVKVLHSQTHNCDAPCEIMNDGDYDAFVKKLQDAPFVYVRQASKEEVEQFRKDNPALASQS